MTPTIISEADQRQVAADPREFSGQLQQQLWRLLDQTPATLDSEAIASKRVRQIALDSFSIDVLEIFEMRPATFSYTPDHEVDWQWRG